MKKITYLLSLVFIASLCITTIGWSLPANDFKNVNDQPIVIITVDKLNSIELLNTDLPVIKKFLALSACGLMNIRSSTGYIDSSSGYFSLGAGSRGTAAGLQGGTFEPFQPLIGGNAISYLDWSLGISPDTKNNKPLLVPEIGLLNNQARLEDRKVIPGRLGSIFHRNGWRTCLIGNIDSPATRNRPGGLFLMDEHGLIDEGNVGSSLYESNPNFPYLYRTNIAKVIEELNFRLALQKIILVEFGDFARLDLYREEMTPSHYAQLKKDAWNRLNFFLDQLLHLEASKNFLVILTSPSISKEGLSQKNLLAPLVIYSQNYSTGLLTSGTTNWSGLVANIDLLPTIVNITHLKTRNAFPGKVIRVEKLSHNNVFQKLRLLNERLIIANTNQRSLLNWYMGLISFGWIIGLFSFYLKKGVIGEWLITGVNAIPLSLIILPLFPTSFWQLSGFLLVTIFLTIGFLQIRNVDSRVLIQSGLLWFVLIIDQILGWHLIRFSALGYNAMAGSRYYGLGNEFLGILLAISLLFSYLINRHTSRKWPAPVILGLTIFILSWPQFGAKFGGILAGTIGFAYYLFNLYHWKLNNSKLWFSVIGAGLVLVAIGLWDSMRPPDVQTHIGRFIHLFFSKEYNQVSQIMARKLEMNLKLTVFSPWIRIILLTLLLGIVNKFVTKGRLIRPENSLVWQAILLSGTVAYLVNDAGVLAFATCLAYGFSYVLLKRLEVKG